MNFLKNIAKTLTCMNPFYHNPIVVAADVDHLGQLEERAPLFNPNVDQHTVLAILISNESVRRAVAELDHKSYVVKAALVGGALHVNLYSLMPKADAKTIGEHVGRFVADMFTGTLPVFDAEWAKKGILQYTLDCSGEKPSIKPLTGHLYGLCYTHFLPTQSWVIALEPEQLALLDPSITLH